MQLRFRKPLNMMLFLRLLAAAMVFLYSQHELFAQSFLKHCPDTNLVRLIDREKAETLLKHSGGKPSFLVIFTNYCDGTEGALQTVSDLRRRYKDSIQILLCSSAPYKDMQALPGILHKNGIVETPVYMIDSKQYKDKSDDRVKGKKFRDDLCKTCRKDPIGVPYKMLFDKNGNLIRAGFLKVMYDEAVIQMIDKALH